MIDNQREYGEMLLDLLGIIPPLDTPLRFRAGYHEAGHIAHGWYYRIHRSVEAVLVLEDAGLAVEAAPIRRTVIEHVVALSWLAVEGDNVVDTIKNAHAEWVALMKNQVESASWSSIDLEAFEEVIRSAAGGDKANDNLKKFWHQAKKYSTSHALVGYLHETGQSHAMWESAAAYLDPETAERFTVAPRGTFPQKPWAVSELLEAVSRFSSIFETVPWQEQLDAIMERFRAATIRARLTAGLGVPDELDYDPERDLL